MGDCRLNWSKSVASLAIQQNEEHGETPRLLAIHLSDYRDCFVLPSFADSSKELLCRSSLLPDALDILRGLSKLANSIVPAFESSVGAFPHRDNNCVLYRNRSSEWSTHLAGTRIRRRSTRPHRLATDCEGFAPVTVESAELYIDVSLRCSRDHTVLYARPRRSFSAGDIGI